ncbi:hypothetical protein CVD28_10595 [Bacillus sp. M6-12]|nr:hypothetical protein CVD28_10595 [Bacillus sp. M6-12]
MENKYVLRLLHYTLTSTTKACPIINVKLVIALKKADKGFNPFHLYLLLFVFKIIILRKYLLNLLLLYRKFRQYSTVIFNKLY